MSRFDRTESGFVSSIVERTTQNPRIGKVTRVYEHTDDADSSNFEIDVTILGEEDIQHRSIPYQSNSDNQITVPTVGQKVMIEYRAGEKKQPIARGAVFTNRDRPPLGKAGINRTRVPSGTTPAGDGDLYIESYTEYDGDPATTDPNDLTAQKAFVKIAKKELDDDETTLPASIEFIDDPQSDESTIAVRLNMDNGSASSATWGVEFDMKTGSFKLLDANGYGIVSNGNGDFTWHYDTISYSENTTTSL